MVNHIYSGSLDAPDVDMYNLIRMEKRENNRLLALIEIQSLEIKRLNLRIKELNNNVNYIRKDNDELKNKLSCLQRKKQRWFHILRVW